MGSPLLCLLGLNSSYLFFKRQPDLFSCLWSFLPVFYWFTTLVMLWNYCSIIGLANIHLCPLKASSMESEVRFSILNYILNVCVSVLSVSFYCVAGTFTVVSNYLYTETSHMHRAHVFRVPSLCFRILIYETFGFQREEKFRGLGGLTSCSHPTHFTPDPPLSFTWPVTGHAPFVGVTLNVVPAACRR